MTDGQGWGQPPQYPPQGYGQQDPQEPPWAPQQYDPGQHQQRMHRGQPPQQQYPPQPPPQWGDPRYAPPYPPQQPPPSQGDPWGESQRQQWQQPYQRHGPPPRRRHTARNVIGGLGALIVVIIGISVAANSGHSVKTSGTPAGTGQSAAAAQSPASARIGSEITLAGDGSGEQMAVTVTKVIGRASPGDEFTQAPAGDRLYAVQFRLKDTGSAAYSDAPSNGAAVVDSAGQSYQSALADTASGCAPFPGTENIAPGDSGLGCIVFEVPAKARITQVQFTLDSGFGPQTGQWDVGKG
jgi:hypothetical protein